MSTKGDRGLGTGGQGTVHGRWTSDFGPWTSDFGLRTFVLLSPVPGPPVPSPLSPCHQTFFLSSSFIMKKYRLFVILFLIPFISCNTRSFRADIIVYGGTSAGVAAAVEASRLGLSVLLVGPDIHLGGLSASGLGWTDSGNKKVVGGLAREVYQRIKYQYDQSENWQFENAEDSRYYKPDQDAVWVFEPHIAERVFEELIREENITVHRDRWLDRKSGVKKENGKISSIRMLNGDVYKGKMFIDASYEGDLMAAAGTSYTLGRESNDQYGESINGVVTKRDISHQFELDIDPYLTPGDPESGLLPRIHNDDPGIEESGDHRIQAYCFRMCLTKVEENRIPFPKPENYDPLQYELLGRYFDQGWRKLFNKFDETPNKKTDTNNSGGFSTDNIGMNYDYPEASYDERAAIVDEHRSYQQGLMWFMAYDPRVPEDVRSAMSQWGLAKDEFLDNNHWPHQIYVREARRMVSDFVMNENHLRGKKATPESIGMGSYNMDSHHVQRYVDEKGFARNEGDVQINPGGPYSISYRAIVPKKEEVTNLLVPVCLSSSHIAYGSIRMEPVFMILGQSAANAAGLAISQGKAVQDISYKELKARLIEIGQVLQLTTK